MKKALSLVLSMVMLLSVFSALTVTVSAANPADVMYVQSNGASGNKLTYDIYLKKNISLVGTIVKVVYDPAVLKPVSGGAHASAASVKGLFVADTVKGTNNAYSMAFVSMDNYNVGGADKAFMTVTFEIIGKGQPKVDVKFYCVEFNTADTNKKIEKNDSNPPLVASFSHTTLSKTVYEGVTCVENGLKIAWKATPGATGYEVFKLNPSGGPSTSLGKTNANTLFFVDTTVAPNTAATYVVRSFNNTGYDSGAVTISGYFLKSPDKVTVAIQPNGVKINWTLVNGVTNYKVFRRTINPDNSRSGWDFLYLANATTTTYTDTKNLVNNTYYEYTVTASTAKGISAVTKVGAIRYFTAPSVSVKAVTGGAQVTWNKIPGAQKYNVYRMYNGAKYWTYIGTVNGETLSYLDSAAVSGRNIFYTVKAVGADGSMSAYVAKKISYVAVPHITAASNIPGGVQVKWNKVANATGYRIYRRAAGEKYWTYITTVKGDAVSYTDKNVKSGTYYKYTVRTVFYKIFSNYESGRLVKYVATPKLTSVKNDSAGVIVKWNSVPAATQYRVYRRGAGHRYWTYLGTVNGTQYTDKNVTSGSYYRYTIRAVAGWYSGFDTNGLVIKR